MVNCKTTNDKAMKYDRIITATTVATTLLFSLLLSACSNGENGGPDIPEARNAQLTIHLASSQNARPVTKAQQEEKEDDSYERKIETCWVVIFDKQGTWKATASTTDFTIDHSDPNSESTARVELPEGTYTGYAFANLNNLTQGDALIQKLESGKQNDNTPLTENYLQDQAVSLIEPANFKPTDGKAIPMSSYAQKLEVSETGKNEANIPLFRMLGKVTISVSNQTGSELTLKQLSMGNFREGAIRLLPYSWGDITLNNLAGKPVHENLAPAFPDNNNTNAKTYTHTVNQPDNETKIANTANATFSFYPFETGTESNTSGSLNVEIKINNRPASARSTGLSFMRRNDWLNIPIVISNIESVIRFKNTRMPVGGLPYEIVYGETDGIQFLVDAVNEIVPGYAGPVDIEVEVKSITGISGLTILASDASGESTLRSSAALTDNEDKLLIDKDKGTPLSTGTTESPTTFPVTIPNPDQPTIARFQIWTQELSQQSEATIRLNLVAEYGDTDPKKRIEIPYIIRIQNYKTTTTRTTQKGGNS